MPENIKQKVASSDHKNTSKPYSLHRDAGGFPMEYVSDICLALELFFDGFSFLVCLPGFG